MKLTTLIIALLWVSPALADSDSLVTLGVGAQYGFVSPSAASSVPEAPGHQYGLVGRLKVLRFLGAEASAQLDQDPKTQDARLLSPRYQLGALVNLVPTSYFNLFVVGGVGAHQAGDLFNINGETTSFHAGPGLEVFIGEHLAVGGDLRWRVAGPSYLKAQVQETLSSEPVDRLVGLDIWQANFTVAWYL